MKNKIKNRRIVITAAEIVSPLGIGYNTFYRSAANIMKKQKVFKNDAKAFNKKIDLCLRNIGINIIDLDEVSKYLLLAAIKLKQKNTLLPQNIVIGTAFASSNSIFEFEKNAFLNGYQATKPNLFPNTVASTAANRLAITNHLPGICETFCNGLCSGLDSIGLAFFHLQQNNKLTSILCGGVEEFYTEMNCFFAKNKPPAGLLNFTAGAGLLVVEKENRALANKKSILGEVIGYRTNTNNAPQKNIENNIRSLLNETNIQPDKISYIFSNTNGIPLTDQAEKNALENIFNKTKTSEIKLKKYLGEGLALSGLMQCIIGLQLLKKKSSKKPIILINNINPEGKTSSLLIGQYENHD